MDTRAPSAHAQHMVKLVKPNSVTKFTLPSPGKVYLQVEIGVVGLLSGSGRSEWKNSDSEKNCRR